MSSQEQDQRTKEPQLPATEGLTEEARKAEPDAAEQAQKLENAGESVLPTIT
uniref:Uncharacterized protein n=1 Tax=Kwoniella dejecticola CBS 10117 TaxID=1296121 RepID=A0A1A5ZXM4_9TREE|nr:uncharacterized protein I303_07317 [Kwoniella dejecticola CBS 10117]OBR82557.1 hypothetical protein I303_07317 [Kwoniella dejecticola CBS 10117]